MPKVPLETIIAHCDKILRTNEIGDYDGAANGLQVENSGAVTKIAADRGREPRHDKTGDCRQSGFADRASRIILESAPAVDGEKL